jgi:hypothetical protein
MAAPDMDLHAIAMELQARRRNIEAGLSARNERRDLQRREVGSQAFRLVMGGVEAATAAAQAAAAAASHAPTANPLGGSRLLQAHGGAGLRPRLGAEYRGGGPGSGPAAAPPTPPTAILSLSALLPPTGAQPPHRHHPQQQPQQPLPRPSSSSGPHPHSRASPPKQRPPPDGGRESSRTSSPDHQRPMLHHQLAAGPGPLPSSSSTSSFPSSSSSSAGGGAYEAFAASATLRASTAAAAPLAPTAHAAATDYERRSAALRRSHAPPTVPPSFAPPPLPYAPLSASVSHSRRSSPPAGNGRSGSPSPAASPSGPASMRSSWSTFSGSVAGGGAGGGGGAAGGGRPAIVVATRMPSPAKPLSSPRRPSPPDRPFAHHARPSHPSGPSGRHADSSSRSPSPEPEVVRRRGDDPRSWRGMGGSNASGAFSVGSSIGLGGAQARAYVDDRSGDDEEEEEDGGRLDEAEEAAIHHRRMMPGTESGLDGAMAGMAAAVRVGSQPSSPVRGPGPASPPSPSAYSDHHHHHHPHAQPHPQHHRGGAGAVASGGPGGSLMGRVGPVLEHVAAAVEELHIALEAGRRHGGSAASHVSQQSPPSPHFSQGGVSASNSPDPVEGLPFGYGDGGRAAKVNARLAALRARKEAEDRARKIAWAEARTAGAAAANEGALGDWTEAGKGKRISPALAAAMLGASPKRVTGAAAYSAALRSDSRIPRPRAGSSGRPLQRPGGDTDEDEGGGGTEEDDDEEEEEGEANAAHGRAHPRHSPGSTEGSGIPVHRRHAAVAFVSDGGDDEEGGVGASGGAGGDDSGPHGSLAAAFMAGRGVTARATSRARSATRRPVVGSVVVLAPPVTPVIAPGPRQGMSEGGPRTGTTTTTARSLASPMGQEAAGTPDAHQRSLSATKRRPMSPAGRRSAAAGAASAAAAASSAAGAAVKGTITASGVGGHGGSSTVSNRQKVANALSMLCLAGPHRSIELATALASMKGCGAANFLVLLASPEALSYRGLYSYEPHTGVCLRLHGTGPTSLTGAIAAAKRADSGAAAADAGGDGDGDTGGGVSPHSVGGVDIAAEERAATYIVDTVYKYVTSSRSFALIPSKAVTLTTDAVTVRARFASPTAGGAAGGAGKGKGGKAKGKGSAAGGMNA